MGKIIRIVGVVFIGSALAAGANAQEMDLVSVGDFNGSLTNIVIGGIESYIVDCDEKEYVCEDNFGNMWAFGDNLSNHRIQMCEPSFDIITMNCVHTVQVNLSLAAPYSDVVFEIQRWNCAPQEFFFDGDYLGSYRLDGSGYGIRTNFEYSLGFVTPGKNKALFITAPEGDDGKCAPTIQVITVWGLSIRGVSR